MTILKLQGISSKSRPASSSSSLITLAALTIVFFGVDRCHARPILFNYYLVKQLHSIVSQNIYIQRESRTRLVPANLEKFMFLKYDLRALGYKSNIPTPSASFIPPNANLYNRVFASETKESEDQSHSDEV